MRPARAAGAILLAFLLGCGPKAPPAAPAAPPSATIHPIRAAAGGVAGEGTGALVLLPPDALPKDSILSVAKKAPDSHRSPGVRAVGPVWSILVDGAEHFTFAKPVTLSVPFDPALQAPGSTVGLSVWSGEHWEKVPGARADPSSSRILAQVSHLSEYAPTQDDPADPVERAQEDLYLKNESWYCWIAVSIRGGGARGAAGAEESVSISREAELTCRLKAIQTELAVNSVIED